MAFATSDPQVVDEDLAWLLAHVPEGDAPTINAERANSLEALIEALIRGERLPATIGLFGGWGSGKTTFLGLLAKRLTQPKWQGRVKIVYFNAWKYAGFMEIVPALIYKILRYGNHPQQRPEKIIAKIMVSLGKDYSDRFGKWAESHLGINPIDIYRDLQNIFDTIEDNVGVPERVIEKYYTQVDDAQNLLKTVFSDPSRCTVVLIDELDRCDPDEAFAVIKQLRVFFGMRQVPICFVLSANPEPIGLAIKHRYGLDTPNGDFEARRILEKFVDTYVDMTEPVSLDAFIRWLWQSQNLGVARAAALISLDEHVAADFAADTVRHATALEAMQSNNPFYCNLRLLEKSLRYVCDRKFDNKHLRWTAWHLEIAQQMDPDFRRELKHVAGDLQRVAARSVERLFSSAMSWHDGGLTLTENPAGTSFGLYHGHFWDAMKQQVADKEREQDADARRAHEILTKIVADHRRMDFIIIMSLLPAEGFDDLREVNFGHLKTRLLQLDQQFGWLLANY